MGDDEPAPIRRAPSVPRRDRIAPIKFIVETNFRRLNVAAQGKGVGGQNGRRKDPTAGSEIIIFDLRRPIGPKSPFDAGAKERTAAGVGYPSRKTGGQIGDDSVVLDPSSASLGIQ